MIHFEYVWIRIIVKRTIVCKHATVFFLVRKPLSGSFNFKMYHKISLNKRNNQLSGTEGAAWFLI